MEQVKNNNDRNIRQRITSMNALANEREMTLWMQEARAKYYKIDYISFSEKNAILDKKINQEEKREERIKNETSECYRQRQSLMESLDTLSKVKLLLCQQRDDVWKSIETLRNDVGKKIAFVEELYRDKREEEEEKSELYKTSVKLKNELKMKKIQNMMVLQNIQELKVQIKLRKQIDQKLFTSKIVAFVKAVRDHHRFKDVEKQVAEKTCIVNNLKRRLKDLESEVKLPRIQINACDDILSRIRAMPSRSLFKPLLNASKTQISSMRPPLDESSIMRKLKERSDVRMKAMKAVSDNPLNPEEIKKIENKSKPDDQGIHHISQSIITPNQNKRIKLTENTLLIPARSSANEKNAIDVTETIMSNKKVTFRKPLPTRSQREEKDGECNQNLNSSVKTITMTRDIREKGRSPFFNKPKNILNTLHTPKSQTNFAFTSPEPTLDVTNNNSVTNTLQALKAQSKFGFNTSRGFMSPEYAPNEPTAEFLQHNMEADESLYLSPYDKGDADKSMFDETNNVNYTFGFGGDSQPGSSAGNPFSFF